MPQQRKITVKTTGNPHQDEENPPVVITVSDEDARKLDGLDRWVRNEKNVKKRKIDNVRFEPV
jgi:hypothetical protein